MIKFIKYSILAEVIIDIRIMDYCQFFRFHYVN